MKEKAMLRGLLLVICIELTATPASAFFHLWRFTEFFSNHDGSVQFIELAALASGENFAQGATITSSATGKVFTFPSNLAGNTSNKRLLIATSGFGSLEGAVAPDFTLPSTNFFNPAMDTLTLSAGFPIDTKSFTALPTDGVTARHYNPQNGQTSLGTNNPTNYAGMTGSVILVPPVTPTGDYNGNNVVDAADYVVWRNTFGQNVAEGTGADGDRSGMIDQGDYNFWRMQFGSVVSGSSAGSGASVPEPSTIVMLLGALAFMHKRTNRTLATQRVPAG
jgi:serralysin